MCLRSRVNYRNLANINWTNNPEGYSSDTTNLGSKDGEKTDTMSKRTLKTNIIKMCVKVKLVVSMNKHINVY